MSKNYVLLERNVERIPESGCWIWMGAIGGGKQGGYGNLTLNRKNVKAHRYSWELHNGKIPDGLCVCHTCDVRSCVNPDHMFLGSRLDNAKDRDNKGRNKTNPMPGEKHPLAILTESNVREIRQSSEKGRILARRFGVSEMTISNVRHNVTWRHVV